MIEVIDNYLPADAFQKIRDTVFSNNDFPWYYMGNVTGDHEDDLYYLVHILQDNMGVNSSYYTDIGQPLVDTLNFKAFIRIKVNCYPKGKELVEHGLHSDYGYDHKGAIYSINTCNGYTRFETGEKIDSVANRMIFFNPNIFHTSTNTTDQKRRININFNYF